MQRKVDGMGRSMAPGRSRVKPTAVGRSKYTKPLPLHMACHAPKARRTKVPHGRVTRSFPMLEEMSIDALIEKLEPWTKRAVPIRVLSRTRGRLGWTADEGLALTLCRKDKGDIYIVRGV